MRDVQEVIERALEDLPQPEAYKGEHASLVRAALAAAGLAVVPLCGCPQRPAVVTAARTHGPNSDERWRLCGQSLCPAVEIEE